MPDSIAVIDFQLDHVIADFHGGEWIAANTA